MRTKFHATNADEMEFTMSITMKLSEWRDLQDAIGHKYPGWKFSEAITGIISQAQKTFMDSTPTDDD